MTADTTLFAHVIPKLTSQMEGAATQALEYILSESEAARRGVADMAAHGGAGTFTIAHLETEVSGESRERVDLVGFDAAGAERLLIEAKFRAGLTVNQPNTYLARLPADGPAVLLFVVPTARLESLWPEVRQRAAAEYTLAPDLDSGNLRSAALEGNNRYLMMTSWSNILDILREAAVADGAAKTEFEIAQLRGLVDNMEMNTQTFLPLNSTEMEPDIPRRILALMRLVDDAVERAVAEGWVSSPRGSTPSGGGYGKYVYLCGVNVWFGIYLRQWARHGISPLWLWPAGQDARSALRGKRSSPDDNHFPVELPFNVEYDAVLDAAVSQLEQFGRLLSPDGMYAGA